MWQLLAQSRAPAEQLLRADAVPPRHLRDNGAPHKALGDDLHLLLQRPLRPPLLHPTTVRALKQYLTLRQRHLPTAQGGPFLASARGTALAKRTVHWVFDRLRKQLGWTARGGHAAPRIHDLRHTFICRRVQLWHANGTDIDNAMVALSTYVGHAKVSDTYWYLTAAPDLMSVAARRFELFVEAGDA